MEISIENLTKKFEAKIAVDNMNTKICSGELVGLVGANGAGKTTLIKLLTTIIKPTSGRILLDNTDIVQHKHIIRKVLGYLPQEVRLYDNLSAFEYLNYIASIKGMKFSQAKEQIFYLLENLNLLEVKNKLLKTFSGGMRQRVGIAASLLGNPQIIVYDEPTIGLDPQERISLRNILSELSRSRIVILSTHIVSDIEAIASKVIIMKSGKMIYDGSPEKLVKNISGCVWEYTVPKLKKQMMCVSNMIQTEKGVLIRQVSKKRPVDTAIQVTGKLEDACLFMLEG